MQCAQVSFAFQTAGLLVMIITSDGDYSYLAPGSGRNYRELKSFSARRHYNNNISRTQPRRGAEKPAIAGFIYTGYGIKKIYFSKH